MAGVASVQGRNPSWNDGLPKAGLGFGTSGSRAARLLLFWGRGTSRGDLKLPISSSRERGWLRGSTPFLEFSPECQGEGFWRRWLDFGQSTGLRPRSIGWWRRIGTAGLGSCPETVPKPPPPAFEASARSRSDSRSPHSRDSSYLGGIYSFRGLPHTEPYVAGPSRIRAKPEKRKAQ